VVCCLEVFICRIGHLQVKVWCMCRAVKKSGILVCLVCLSMYGVLLCISISVFSKGCGGLRRSAGCNRCDSEWHFGMFAVFACYMIVWVF